MLSTFFFVKHLLNTSLLILGRYGSENGYEGIKFRIKGICLHQLIQCMKESSSVSYLRIYGYYYFTIL